MAMEYIDVLMPTKEGRFIPQAVLESLLHQNIPFRLWVSTAVSNGDYAKARNNIKQYAHSQPYALMLDNDVILPEGAIDTMMKFLDTYEDFAAIALKKYDSESGQSPDFLMAEEAEHIDMSCVLFRAEELLALVFSYPSGDFPRRQGCECSKACQDIRQSGKRIGFIRGLAARHIYDTEISRLTRPMT